MGDGRIWLLAAGWMSVAASLLHLACIAGGPDWYRFLGAGEGMARAAERGLWAPALMTMTIALIIAGWAAFAFSAAGILPRLPLLRLALVAISAVLLLRASAYFIHQQWRPDLSHSFMAWSSAIVLVMGLAFAIGTWKAWPALSKGSL